MDGARGSGGAVACVRASFVPGRHTAAAFVTQMGWRGEQRVLMEACALVATVGSARGGGGCACGLGSSVRVCVERRGGGKLRGACVGCLCVLKAAVAAATEGNGRIIASTQGVWLQQQQSSDGAEGVAMGARLQQPSTIAQHCAAAATAAATAAAAAADADEQPGARVAAGWFCVGRRRGAGAAERRAELACERVAGVDGGSHACGLRSWPTHGSSSSNGSLTFQPKVKHLSSRAAGTAAAVEG
ncbi:unnamed protein product [Closterium sp. NIES-65]|nr:unnamed protein product [Closterium sp. NIES-65]